MVALPNRTKYCVPIILRHSKIFSSDKIKGVAYKFIEKDPLSNYYNCLQNRFLIKMSYDSKQVKWLN